jgi:hypothetical protein
MLNLYLCELTGMCHNNWSPFRRRSFVWDQPEGCRESRQLLCFLGHSWGGGGVASVHKETSTEFGWKDLVRNGTYCNNTGRAQWRGLEYLKRVFVPCDVLQAAALYSTSIHVLRNAILWATTPWVVVIPYRCFGTTNRPHSQGSRCDR